jgi:hypothetical protein
MASSIQSAFRRQVLPGIALATALFWGEPATITSALPPRRGSRRVFTAPRLSPGAARPFAVREVVHLRMRGAGRRLSTSATTTIREHDRRITRTPHTTPRVAPMRSFARQAPFRGRDELRVAPESQPRFHGSGVGQRADALHARRLSTRSLAPRASPQPDRLGHLLSHDSLVRTTGAVITSLSIRFEAQRRARPASPAETRSHAFRAASTGSPRREPASAAPEVPSVEGTTREGLGSVRPQPVPSLWTTRSPCAFSIP